MKLKIDIDCTPEEARRSLGLPDLTDMHAAMGEEITARMKEAMKTMQPEQLLRAWMPGGMPGMETWQNAFMDMMAGKSPRPGDDTQK